MCVYTYVYIYIYIHNLACTMTGHAIETATLIT